MCYEGAVPVRPAWRTETAGNILVIRAGINDAGINGAGINDAGINRYSTVSPSSSGCALERCVDTYLVHIRASAGGGHDGSTNEQGTL